MYKNILHATDLNENHYPECEQAAAIAKQFDAQLHLLHVIEVPASYQWAQSLGFTELAQPVKNDAETVMHLIGESLNIPLSQQSVEIGSAKSIILKKVKKLDCDLVIIGRHTPRGISGFLGSTAHAVIHHASCDVLVLK